MKSFERKNTAFIAGALFIYVASFNALYADGLKGGFNNGAFKSKGSCNLKCTPIDPKQPKGVEECVWVPAGCNNKAGKLGIPNSQLQQLINPQLVKPQLIIPKRNFIPGDQFQPKKLSK